MALSAYCISVGGESRFACLGFGGFNAVRDITAGTEINLIGRLSVEGGVGDLTVVGFHIGVVVLVRLTEKGLNVYRRLTRRILALHREQWSALSETELRELRRLLVKVLGEDQSQAKLRTVGRTVGQPGAATVA